MLVVFLRTNNFTISIYVNLFLCLEFYSKILICLSGYFVYNSNRPTSQLLNSDIRLIDLFADWYLLSVLQRTCRIERTRGKAVLGKLPDAKEMLDMYCCQNNCVMVGSKSKISVFLVTT